MSELLDEVSAADGAAERWHAVTAITAHSTGGGVLRSRLARGRAPAAQCCNQRVRAVTSVWCAEQSDSRAAATALHGKQQWPAPLEVVRLLTVLLTSVGVAVLVFGVGLWSARGALCENNPGCMPAWWLPVALLMGVLLLAAALASARKR